MALKNIIFDLDGTLVDSLPGIEYAVDCALRARNYPVRSCELRPLIGPPIRNILRQVSGETSPEALDRLEAAFRHYYDSEGWSKSVLQTEAQETLNWIARTGGRIYVVTNKPHGPAQRIAERLGLPILVSEMVSPDCASPPYRSKAEMIQQLMQKDEVYAWNSLIVGDTREDVEAAYEVGMAAVIVMNGYGRIREIVGTVCRKIQALGELRSVIADTGGFA
jgi:phosphoglycolate phosphatase